MKILFLTRAYGQQAGGMERLSYEFIQAASQQPGVQTHVISHQGSRLTSPLFNFTALPQVLAAAKQADVIHLGDPMLSLLGWLLKKFTHKPVVITVHGLDIIYPNFLYQLYLKLFFQSFNLYFPTSNYVNDLLSSKFNIPYSKFQILTPGVSDRFYDTNIKKDNGNQKILFTSGRLIKRKGHEWFICEVLPHLSENVEYVIAGQGPESKNLIPLQERNRVTLLGKISEAELQILYNTADAFIMPNIPVDNDVEGFGLVLLEAALCNLPVFAANLEGIPDAIQNGQNGALLPPKNTQAWVNALTGFLKNPPQDYNSRDYTLEHFSWHQVAPAITKSLSALVPGQSTSESKMVGRETQK